MTQQLFPNCIAKTTSYITNAEQTSISTFFWRTVSVGAPAATDADLATSVDFIYGTDMKQLISTNSDYRGTLAQIIWPLPVYTAQQAIALAGLGAQAPPDLPRQATGITTWQTVKAGKGYRGRTYWPFPAAVWDTGDGTPSNAYQAALVTMSGNLLGLTNISVGGRTAVISLVLWHRKLHTEDAVFTAVVRGRWATQRRRGSYGRPNASPL